VIVEGRARSARNSSRALHHAQAVYHRSDSECDPKSEPLILCQSAWRLRASCTTRQAAKNRSRIRFNSAAYCSSLYSRMTNFFRVGVIARINAHLFDPFGCFHRCVGFLKVDVRPRSARCSRARADFLTMCSRFRAILHRRRGDSNNLTAGNPLTPLFCWIDASVSIVSQVIIDWTRIGLFPPMPTFSNVHLARFRDVGTEEDYCNSSRELKCTKTRATLAIALPFYGRLRILSGRLRFELVQSFS